MIKNLIVLSLLSSILLGCGNYNRLRLQKIEQSTPTIADNSASVYVEPIDKELKTTGKNNTTAQSLSQNQIIEQPESRTAYLPSSKVQKRVLKRSSIQHLKEQWNRIDELKSDKYPGQHRRNSGVWKIILGILMIALGTLIVLVATIGNIGAYGLDIYTLLAVIGGLLLIAGGIILMLSRNW